VPDALGPHAEGPRLGAEGADVRAVVAREGGDEGGGRGLVEEGAQGEELGGERGEVGFAEGGVLDGDAVGCGE
jgi:hypothetical protein